MRFITPYDEISKELITYMKNAKSKLRESVKNDETSEKFNQKEILRIEVDILEQKIFQVNSGHLHYSRYRRN